MYTYIDAELTEHHSLAVASQRVDRGVICLLSALQFHGIGTQAPFEVWVAIDVHARRPNSDALSLHPVYMSGLALSGGIETHTIRQSRRFANEGTPVRIFTPAKTIVDCFKYRHRVWIAKLLTWAGFSVEGNSREDALLKLDLQKQLLEIIDAAITLELSLFESFGETERSIIYLDELQSIAEQATDRFSRFSTFQSRIAM